MNQKRKEAREEQERIIRLFEALHRVRQNFFDFLHEDGIFLREEKDACPELASVSDEVFELYNSLLFTKSEGLTKNVLEVQELGRCIASSPVSDKTPEEWRALSKATNLVMADLYMTGSQQGFARELDAKLTPIKPVADL